MSNHYIIKEETLTNIADSIREKLGTEDSYSPDDMASGVNEVYEAGKNVGKSERWDIIQNCGKRKIYMYAFARWNGEEYLDPPYFVQPTDARFMFQGNTMKAFNKEKFDLSNANYNPTSSASSTYGLCEYCNYLEIFPDIGLQAGYYGGTFCDNGRLHTIEILRFNENVVISSVCFRACHSLVNLTIEGVIGRNFPISYSPLSIESMKSIITHLKDYSGTTGEYTYTVTFKASAFEALEAEGATAEYTDAEGNTTLITWAEYIDNLKWNLVKA